jgi:hypothetical protein
MTIELVPLRLPPSADASKFTDFGREVKGVNPGRFTPEEFQELKDAVYKVDSTAPRIFASAWAQVDYSTMFSCSGTLL